MKRYAIILAAGKGSRMKSLRNDISKVSFPILGQPLVKYVINALKPLSIEKIVAVIGFGGATSEPIVKEDCEVAWQKEQKGSGHAVMMCRPQLESLDGETIVCCGDTPLLRSETLNAMFEKHEREHNYMTVMTTVLQNPFGYGRIDKNVHGDVLRIIEQKDTNEETARINEVNAGVYIFDNKALFGALGKLTTQNAAGEYYLTDVLEIFVKQGLKVQSFLVDDIEETLGVNDRAQLATAAKILQLRINKKLMLSGVSIEDPESTYIAPSVEIEQDAIIKPGSYLIGRTHIGSGSVIGPNAYIKDCDLGSRCVLPECHIESKKLEEGTSLPPFSTL